jgi:hypothetical protein
VLTEFLTDTGIRRILWAEGAGMRTALHGVDDALPEPKVDLSGLTKDELWEAVNVLGRLMGEATRRRLASDVFGSLDVARAVALAMYSTTDRPGHSEQVA